MPEIVVILGTNSGTWFEGGNGILPRPDATVSSQQAVLERESKSRVQPKTLQGRWVRHWFGVERLIWRRSFCSPIPFFLPPSLPPFHSLFHLSTPSHFFLILRTLQLTNFYKIHVRCRAFEKVKRRQSQKRKKQVHTPTYAVWREVRTFAPRRF